MQVLVFADIFYHLDLDLSIEDKKHQVSTVLTDFLIPGFLIYFIFINNNPKSGLF
jgi:hypothetical protein